MGREATDLKMLLSHGWTRMKHGLSRSAAFMPHHASLLARASNFLTRVTSLSQAGAHAHTTNN
jgi:hypothetical protein